MKPHLSSFSSTYRRARVSMEKAAARSRPDATSRSTSVGAVVEHSAQAGGQRVGIARLDQHGVGAAPGHVAVAGEIAGHHRRPCGHRLEQDDAEGLPSDRRGTEDVGGTQPGGLLVGRRSGPATRSWGRRRCLARSRSVSGPVPATHSLARRVGEPAHGVDEDVEALARLVAADEENHPLRSRRSGPARPRRTGRPRSR